MEKSFKNIKTSSGGLGLKINDFSSVKTECPKSYINVIKELKQSSKEYADDEEYKYFLEFLEKAKFREDFGWDTLSLQEKKVISGLEEFKIPAYLGYRKSFGRGISRKNYKNKPIFALLEVASACNIKCPFCFQSDPTFTTKEFMGVIETNLAFKILDEIDEMKIRGITIASRGEPLLCKDLGKILSYISTKKNILEVKLNTNAKRLTEDKLEMLINSPVNILVISTDHHQKELYEKYRHGANYDNFINNISRINSKRKFFNRESDLYTRASGVAVDKKMDLKEYHNFYSNYFDESGTVKMSERWDTYNNDVYQEDLRPCGLPFERLYIWYDGVTNPCDTDYKSYLSPGNVKELSLRKCWENLSNLRESMLNGKRQENMPCDRCYVA